MEYRTLHKLFFGKIQNRHHRRMDNLGRLLEEVEKVWVPYENGSAHVDTTERTDIDVSDLDFLVNCFIALDMGALYKYEGQGIGLYWWWPDEQAPLLVHD